MEDRARPLRALPRGQSPPPPLQTSSDAEVMDVGSGGDGQAEPPAEDPLNFYGASLLSKGSSSKARLLVDPNCSGHSPRTARHAPAVRKFSPDLKLLKDVKISVSFTESCRSEDRKVLRGDRRTGRHREQLTGPWATDRVLPRQGHQLSKAIKSLLAQEEKLGRHIQH